MHITFCCAATDAQPWLEGLRAALPGAHISLWQSGAPAAEYAIVWQPPQAFFDEQPQLKVAFNIGAGVDAMLRLNIAPTTQLIRLDDAGMGVQMAEYVCHALIRHYRQFTDYDADKEAGVWQQREVLPRTAMPVGIMGLGVLGQRVAQAVAQFDFPVNGWSRSPKDLPGVRCFHGAEGFRDFLASSRVLVSVLPATPETRDIINRDTLSRLQRGAYLINVARGTQLVEEDLLALLDSGHMAGAALDVFRTEPLPSDHPFWTHAQIRITPHSAALTVRSESIAQIVSKIAALQAGKPVVGVVDRVRGY
jgi:glyoxylate/hydroxypyruvate reductase A